MKFTIFTTLFILVTQIVWAQSGAAPKRNYRITGKIVDQSTKKPLEYATVRLLSLPDSALITGAVTDATGIFSVTTNQSGNYVLEANFIGFSKKNISLKLNPDNRDKDLGSITLSPSAQDLSEVTVKANRHAVEYQIDKKVLHVSQQLTAISGTAVDALQNAPAIQVDIEGNVSLRGNSNFTVLIDGRPTVLDATEALEQIPASSIQDIEIITNPSAKYDPEGTAGIINIITKKRSLEGISGTASLNVGLDDKYGADMLLNFRSEHFNVFVAGDYNDRRYPGAMEAESQFYGTPDYFQTSFGERNRGRLRYSGRAGVEWFPNESNTFSISGRYGTRASTWNTETEYAKWTSDNTDKIYNFSIEDGQRGGYFYSVSGDYVHQFSGSEHKFDANIMFYTRDGKDETTNNLRDIENNIVSGQKSGESGPSSGFRYRANYMQSFSQALKIETGVQGRFRDSQENNEIYYYNTNNQTYDLQKEYSHNVTYLRSIHAVYGLTKGEYSSFGYQLGLRGEYTYRDINMNDINKNYNINRMDYFPTTHFSYKLNKNQQFMASYSRRIDRPRGWYLEPFETWTDAYNVRMGNPELKPEYIDAFELGYQTNFGENALTTELYYRTTENKIERIRGVWPDGEGIMLHTFENVGTDYALGVEVMLNLLPLKWWEADLTGNFYDYRVKGQLNDIVFDESSFTWSLRWNNTIKLGKNTSLQMNPFYRGPSIEPQERQEGYFRVDGALKQTFMERKLQMTLQVRDIFGTGKWEATTESPDLYTHRLYTHKSPIVMLNITWRINNYKGREGRNGGGEENGGGDMEGGM